MVAREGRDIVRNISLLQIFYKSLYSFTDIAKFRFLSIGKTIQYVFILICIYFVPSLINSIIIEKDSTNLIPDFDAGSVAIMLPIFIFFMFVLNTGILFLKVSILAYIAKGLANLLKRKLPYRLSWRLTAYSITLPTIIFGLEPLLPFTIPYGFFIDLALTFFYIYASINKMPVTKK